MLHDPKQKYNSSFTDWIFYKVIDSEYLTWLSKQSYGITDSSSLMQFSILSMESIVDVITSGAPKIEFVNANSKLEHD